MKLILLIKLYVNSIWHQKEYLHDNLNLVGNFSVFCIFYFLWIKQRFFLLSVVLEGIHETQLWFLQVCLSSSENILQKLIHRFSCYLFRETKVSLTLTCIILVSFNLWYSVFRIISEDNGWHHPMKPPWKSGVGLRTDPECDLGCISNVGFSVRV